MERRKATLPAFMFLSCIVLSSQFVAKSADAHAVYLTDEQYGLNIFLRAVGFGDDGSRTQADVDNFSFNQTGDREFANSVQVGESFASYSFSYQSSTQSSGNSFVYSVTGQGTATASAGLESGISTDNALAMMSWNYLQLEFLVTEEVLYEGGFLLADVPVVQGAYRPGGNFFGSGSILGPGTYSFLGGRDIAGPASAFASTGLLDASPGETLSSSFYASNTLRFTAVPTPSSLLLLSTAVALSLLARRKRKHQLVHVHA